MKEEKFQSGELKYKACIVKTKGNTGDFKVLGYVYSNNLKDLKAQARAKAWSEGEPGRLVLQIETTYDRYETNIVA